MPSLNELIPTPRDVIRGKIVTTQAELEERDSDRGGDKWGVYGSPLRDYGRNFYPILGHDKIEKLIEGIDDLTVIDFMAPTDTVAELVKISGATSALGIAVTRDDQRTTLQRHRDDALNIHEIHGSVTDQSSWSQIYQKLQGRKANLILERGLGAIDPRYVPANQRLYEIAIRRCWDILSPNGGKILAQLHDGITLENAGIDIAAWRELAQNHGITARYFLYRTPAYTDSGDKITKPSKVQTLLYIKRHPESPSRFPFPRFN